MPKQPAHERCPKRCRPAELDELEAVIERGGPSLTSRVLCAAPPGGWPVYAIACGNPEPSAPALAVVGGIHGLERIGAQVAIAYLDSIVSRLAWDVTLRRQLEEMRLVFVPLVNPGGMWLRTRANPRGVDLMRNAPLEAVEPVPFMVGGQRRSPRLPWYRGAAGAPMEAEAAALCALVREELLVRPFSMVVDCHSGFGVHDRIWFPYAHTASPIRHLPEMHALMEILDRTLAYHRYVFEPQSRQYLAHGDLWDYLYLEALADATQVFLPLTLEMGSWLWVKKNPRQLFSRHGIFNPLIEHRQRRVLRRHVSWLDFLARAVASHAHWVPRGDAREVHQAQAMARWYASGTR